MSEESRKGTKMRELVAWASGRSPRLVWVNKESGLSIGLLAIESRCGQETAVVSVSDKDGVSYERHIIRRSPKWRVKYFRCRGNNRYLELPAGLSPEDPKSPRRAGA